LKRAAGLDLAAHLFRICKKLSNSGDTRLSRRRKMLKNGALLPN
jgi:hypothetical protein